VRHYSDKLRASLSSKESKDVPEDVKARLLAIHEENVTLKEQAKSTHDKLLKARAVG
jgi:protein HOOK3